ncbi:MAG: DUF4434 domain-containing protein [Bacteroidales bacterium]|nr:DUF4434 domain-containing protein [Bacteroidales bacterium]
MKLQYIALSFVLALLAGGCDKDDYKIPIGSDAVPTDAVSVKILRNSSGEWQMTVGDTPFYVNGAATNRYYTDVRKFGGNTIRLYSPKSADTKDIMDDAYKAGLKVYLGLGMSAAEYMDYTDAKKVADQKETILNYVRQYKNHPALLCWSIGNEIEASNENNLDLWKAVGDIAKSIDELDGKHPITCALAGSATARLQNLVKYAPEVDFISVNSYYPSVGNIAANIAAAGIDLPYMVTEFGPRGTWAMSAEPGRILPWGDNYSSSSSALVEETSTEKENVYLNILEQDIKAKQSQGCIGSFVFVWGYQTHGEVLNWYSTHTVDHYSYGVCDAMQKCWTGEWPSARAPRIESRNDMTMNGLIADNAIKVKAGSDNTAKVTAKASTEVNLRYHWIIFREGDHKSDGSMPDGIENLIADNALQEISFKAPSAVGGYRLYVFVLDDVNKKAASACIPFCVE